MLPLALLCSTLAVRLLIWRRKRVAFLVDGLSIPGWMAYYAGHGDWPLLIVPVIFGLVDISSWMHWGRRAVTA